MRNTAELMDCELTMADINAGITPPFSDFVSSRAVMSDRVPASSAFTDFDFVGEIEDPMEVSETQ